VGLSVGLVSKIISNMKIHNTNNVDKRSTLKPEDYPAVAEIISNTKNCNANILAKRVEEGNNVTGNIISLPDLRVKIPKVMFHMKQKSN